MNGVTLLFEKVTFLQFIIPFMDYYIHVFADVPLAGYIDQCIVRVVIGKYMNNLQYQCAHINNELCL